MKTLSKIVLFFLLIATVSCDDVLEKDITDSTIAIISPKEGEVVLGNVVNFQWNALKGAKNYRLQVLGQNQVIVKDTLTDKLLLTLPLNVGNYNWRIRGENSGYQSAYNFPVGFKVNSSTDLTMQQVLLSSPSDNSYTNSQSFIVSWQALTNANSYDIEVANLTNSNTIVFQQSGLTNTNFTLNSSILNQDAKYEWRIKGKNSSNNTQTPFSSRVFYLDKVAPNQPQNSAPANNTTTAVNQAITFTWTLPADSGVIQSPIDFYTIEIASDVNFTTIVQSSNTTILTFQRTFSTTGIYYWRVKVTDKASNTSITSAPFKLTVN